MGNCCAIRDKADKELGSGLKLKNNAKVDPFSNLEQDVKYSLRLGSIIPNFQYKSTHGSGNFHDFLKNSGKGDWTLLFSHPRDYTPVCTTELAQCHTLSADFESMGIKLCGISCDNLEDHCGWTKDVLKWAGDDKSKQQNFPIIEDPKRELVTRLGMLDPLEKDAAGVPLPARALYIIGSNCEVKLAILYPATTGRNFEEIKRVVTSLKMTVDLKLATPVNWKKGDRCIVAPGLTTEDAKKNFKNLKVEELPSGKSYLRTVDCPKPKVLCKCENDYYRGRLVAEAFGYWTMLQTQSREVINTKNEGKTFNRKYPQIGDTTQLLNHTSLIKYNDVQDQTFIDRYVRQMCEKLGVNCSDTMMQKFFKILDSEQDNSISLGELLHNYPIAMQEVFKVENPVSITKLGKIDDALLADKDEIQGKIANNCDLQARELMGIYEEQNWNWLKEISKTDMRNLVEKLCQEDRLDKLYSKERSDKIFENIDADSSGTITIGEMMEYGPTAQAENLGFDKEAVFVNSF